MEQLVVLTNYFKELAWTDQILTILLALFVIEQVVIYTSSNYPYVGGICLYSKPFTRLSWEQLTRELLKSKNIQSFETENGLTIRATRSVFLGTAPIFFVGHFVKNDPVRIKIMSVYMALILILYLYVNALSQSESLVLDSLQLIAPVFVFFWVNVGRRMILPRKSGHSVKSLL